MRNTLPSGEARDIWKSGLLGKKFWPIKIYKYLLTPIQIFAHMANKHKT